MRCQAGLALLLLSVAGCTVYPTLERVGGVKVRPENGRVLHPAAAGGTAIVYVDVVNSGGADDTLVGVLSEVAARAELRGRTGRIPGLRVPAAVTVPLDSDTRHIELYGLKRDLNTGDVIIVTLVFEKSGAIGAITVVR